MTSTPRMGRGGALALGLLAGVQVMTGCQQKPPPDPALAADSAAVASFRPECPTYNGVTFVRRSPRLEGGSQLVTLGNLTVPGIISNIPEFHDCQRFIAEAGDRYGPLVAIWASAKLDTIWPAHLQPQATTLPVAEILSYDDDYAPLWIRRNFSCLYIVGDQAAASGYIAYIWWVDENETLCGEQVRPDTLSGVKKLTVLRKRRSPRFQDYPPVARWDWDSTRKQQYIGIACGAAWCSVGAPGLTESIDYDDDSPPMTEVKRVLRIKGWYDEQRLAITAGTALRPAEPLATVIPDPRLDRHNDVSDFRNRWVPVAQTSFSGFPADYPYQSKLGFTATSMFDRKFNRVDMCLGSAVQCLKTTPIPPKCTDSADAWWARIRPAAQGAPTVYRCVVRHDHSGLNLPIPATARWRWLLNDETLWVRCAQGCCTVTGEE